MNGRTSKNSVRAIVDHDIDLMEMFTPIEHGEVEVNNGKCPRSHEQKRPVVNGSRPIGQDPLCSHHFVVGSVAQSGSTSTTSSEVQS